MGHTQEPPSVLQTQGSPSNGVIKYKDESSGRADSSAMVVLSCLNGPGASALLSGLVSKTVKLTDAQSKAQEHRKHGRSKATLTASEDPNSSVTQRSATEEAKCRAET